MVDLVLVLSVNPGYSGQRFLPEVLPKLTSLRRQLEKVNPSVWLEVDGGINAQTLPLALEAGANVFVAAHAIFDFPAGIAAGVQQLRAHFPG
jgi:ribulose-phosphate 3-epimerase